MILIGDVHGEFGRLIRNLEFCPRETSFIQVGDFGLGFYSKEYDEKILRAIDAVMIEKDSHFFIMRGNHDNPEVWRREYNLERVHLVGDNELLEIDNQQVFFLGGGISIDRTQRKLGESYWIDELVDVDFDRIDQLDHVDIVVTHVAPRGAWPIAFNGIVDYYATIESRHGMDLKSDLNLERDLMGLVKERLLTKGVKHWFYGHYHHSHVEFIEGVQYRCLDIMEYHAHVIE